MYNHEPVDYDCVFCKIVKGEDTNIGNREKSVVFRDKIITAFVNGKWWKSNVGSITIIPNQHVEHLYDMPEELGHRIFDFSKKAAIALKEVYQCDGVSTRQHNEPAGNQDICHYHLHVFPRYHNDNLYVNHADTYWPTMEEIEPYASKLRAYFSVKL